METRNPAIVLGLFETGLAVGRSLGRNGIKVIGLDYKKNMAYYSKYMNTKKCPHPISAENKFIEFFMDYKGVLIHASVNLVIG